MTSANASVDEARRAVEKLASAEFFETVKMLADPELRAALTELAERASLGVLDGAKNIQDAVMTLVGPELGAALEKFNSPAIQEALRKASAALLTPQSKT